MNGEMLNIVFSTEDPLGNTVNLYDSGLLHVETGHPELKGHSAVIRETVEDPDYIYVSNKVATRDEFLSFGVHPNYPNLYVVVIVERKMDAVVTAYVQKKSPTTKRGLKYDKSSK